MKYFLAATAFWTLGYIIPSFPVFLQYLIGAMVVLFLASSLFYFIDTRVYARMLHEEGEENIPEQFL